MVNDRKSMKSGNSSAIKTVPEAPASRTALSYISGNLIVISVPMPSFESSDIVA